jgi:hypothetical protein
MYSCNSNNLLKPCHLYSKPYILPCGNSVCLDYIYLNYNLYRYKFKCNFENCREEHQLNKKLKRNDELIDSINQNLGDLLEALIEKGKTTTDNLGKNALFELSNKLV